MNTFRYKLLKNFGALKKGDIVAKRWKMDGSDCVYTDFYCKIVNESYDYKHELNQSLVEDNTEFFTPYAFTTEDKVDMYVGENYYYIDYANRIGIATARTTSEATFPFSTKEAAENYLLLEEAKRRYPIGTKFYPAHMSKEIVEIPYTVKSHVLENPSEFPTYISFISDKTDYYVANVYTNGKWAEIAENFEEGDYLILENSINLLNSVSIEKGSLALIQSIMGELINVVFLHKPELGTIASLKHKLRKATDKEIISHYEKQGWVNGAKFVLDDKVRVVFDIGYNKNTKLVIVRPYLGGAYSIDKCTLIEEYELPKSWEDLTLVKGYYVKSYADIHKCENTKPNKENKNVFKTEKQVKSALAFAQLSQLVAEMNGDWTPDWGKNGQIKYGIMRQNNELIRFEASYTFRHLCFKSKELRNFSLENHRTLWEQYWEL